MKLFNLFSTEPKKTVTKKKFEESVCNQSLMVPIMLERFREHSVALNTELKLAFFFYTKSSTKAQALGVALSKLNYQVEYLQCGFLKKTIMITGWTVEMPMQDAAVLSWIKEMCQFGYDFDCEFDAWDSPLEH